MHDSSRTDSAGARGDGIGFYFGFSCLFTWLLALPALLAWMRHETPSPLGIACAGLSAFGPLFAALVVAAPRGRLREVFGRWRTHPRWVALALFAPMALHLIATLLYRVAGGQSDAWLSPPLTAEHLAALVVFPIGEEFGWRGFAHGPMVRRFGPVRGSLLLGAGWGIWHLAYAVTPQVAGFDGLLFVLTLVDLTLYALPIAWVFERANRSMAVAIAFHAGGHLDHLERAAAGNLPLLLTHLAVVAVVAFLAARSLARSADVSRARG